jgi:glutaredoxin-related protein
MDILQSVIMNGMKKLKKLIHTNSCMGELQDVQDRGYLDQI